MLYEEERSYGEPIPISESIPESGPESNPQSEAIPDSESSPELIPNTDSDSELERIFEKVFDAHQRNAVGQDLQRGVRVNFLRMFLQNVDHHFVIRHQAAGMQRHITPIFRVLLQHPAGEFKYQLLKVSAQLLQVLHRTVMPEQRRAGHFRLRVEQLQGALVLPLGLVQYDQLDHFSSVVSMMASSAATFLSVVPSGFVLAPLRNGNRLSHRCRFVRVVAELVFATVGQQVRKQADHIDRIGVELRKLLHRLAEVLVDEQVMFALLRNVDRLNAPQMGHGGHIQQSLLATHQEPRFMQLRNALDQCALVLHVVKHAHLDGIVDQPNRVRIVPDQTLERANTFAPLVRCAEWISGKPWRLKSFTFSKPSVRLNSSVYSGMTSIWSPRKLPRLPVNENIGSGTGIGTFTPTCPTSMSFTNLRAVAPLVVKMAVPLPYGLLLISSIASSIVSTDRHTSTGPKISSV
uniref:Uncharacterized protein n=1 Tax=Anopheles merus TaxID=30066 RepID=A0A182V1R1_ANOME